MATSRRLPVVGQAASERADAARNRVRILESARDLVRSRSPRDISVDEIATAAGVGKGTVYRRFGDRSGLMEALLDERERRFQERVLSGPPPLGPGATAEERLKAFIGASIDQLEAVGDVMIEVGRDGHWASSAPQRFRIAHVRMLLGQACPGADTEMLAEALLAPLAPQTYVHQRHVAGGDPQRLNDVLRTLVDGILRS